MALNTRKIKMMYQFSSTIMTNLCRPFLKATKQVILDTIINLQVNNLPLKTQYTAIPTTLKSMAVEMTTTSPMHTSSATLADELSPFHSLPPKQTTTLHIPPNDIIHNLHFIRDSGDNPFRFPLFSYELVEGMGLDKVKGCRRDYGCAAGGDIIFCVFGLRTGFFWFGCCAFCLTCTMFL